MFARCPDRRSVGPRAAIVAALAVAFALPAAAQDGAAPATAAAKRSPRDAGPPPTHERLGLDNLFGDAMVLQRDRPIRLWGRAGAGEAVTVRLGGTGATVRADADGHWQATLAARSAGGPFVLTASSPSFRDRYTDVSVGEVWLCAGQSNMEFRLSRAAGFAEGFAPDAKLRFLDIARRQDRAPSPHLMALGPWTHSSPAAAGSFSAVCHGFGQRLRAALGVPVGLIDAAWGGTQIAAFVDGDTLTARGLARIAPIDPASRQNDARLFNGMIAPLAPLSLRGVLWYQGESDTHLPAGYGDRLSALAASWRRAFDQPLPLLVVQLPAFDPTPNDPEGNWAILRDEQRKAVAGDPDAHLVVLADQGDAHNLHPPQKQVVADRAAAVALADVYHRDIVAHGPAPRAIRREGRSLIVDYDAAQQLEPRGGESVGGFDLCAGRCVPAAGRVRGHSVVLPIPDGVDPLRLRYAWADVPVITLFNRPGLPAEPFDLPVGYEAAD